MGRPSAISLEVDVAAGALTAVRVGGHAVLVARGEIRV
jgi:trans-2,3-dihydro-3-hydroxyanthranilate isomerase